MAEAAWEALSAAEVVLVMAAVPEDADGEKVNGEVMVEAERFRSVTLTQRREPQTGMKRRSEEDWPTRRAVDHARATADSFSIPNLSRSEIWGSDG